MKVCKRGHERDDSRVRCIVCRRATTVAWKAAHPDRVAVSARGTAARELADPVKRAKRYAAKNAWHSKNRKEENAKALARYHEMAAAGLVAPSTEKVRAWRAANPKKAAALGSKENQRRRAVSLGIDGSHTEREWQLLVTALGGVCFDCGEPANLERGHIEPASRGGSNFISNIVPQCRSCNARLHAKTHPAFTETPVIWIVKGV